MNSQRIHQWFFAFISGVMFLLPCAQVEAAASISLSVSPATTVAIGTAMTMSVSAPTLSSPTYLLSDYFGGSSLTSANMNSSGVISWTPSASDVGAHTVSITASDSNASGNTSQQIVVIAPTITLQAPLPSATISAGAWVMATSTVTGFVNPTYTVSDSFGGSSANNTTINSSGVFSWTPGAQDVGGHLIRITASDSSGSSKSVTQEIVVTPLPTLVIQSISPSTTIGTGQTLTFTAVPTGFPSPSYSVSDSYLPRSSVTVNNIDSTGKFTWTPIADETGNHNILVVVTDGVTGRTLSKTQAIIVTPPSLAIQPLTKTMFTLGDTVQFNLLGINFGSSTYALSDTFTGSTASSSMISATGTFAWIPTAGDLGIHQLTITATDASGVSRSVSQSLSISGFAVSIQAVYPGRTTMVGVPLTFSVSSANFTNPLYTLTDAFALPSSMANKNLSTLGSFSWTPVVGDIGTHTIIIVANDTLGHQATTTMTVVVNAAGGGVVTTTPSVSTATLFTLDLRSGSSGKEVTALQTALTEGKFYSGPITGTFGPMTEAALKRFQIAQGLSPVGFVGPGTRAALNKGKSGGVTTTTPTTTPASAKFIFTRPLDLNSKGTDVAELQKRLTALGIYTGAISGNYGPLTLAAVKEFQKKNGLAQLGNVGPGTRALLNK